ncbi:hypothetical protein [Variovorax sp. dw_308]|uniref:hypothetical protein n=1 Tax=Variovorax sp. dw_308 TaxID=2721546 RepID=UPI001C487539|nr:hypothetical protein [Variovorax sp. dw_308]
MSPAEVCRAIYAAGMTVRADGVDLVLKPADRLTPALRELLLAHKPELVEFLHDAADTAADLLEAAMRVCDLHGDGDEAREEMRRDCLALPPHLQADLLGHWRGKRAGIGQEKQAKAGISAPSHPRAREDAGTQPREDAR